MTTAGADTARDADALCRETLPLVHHEVTALASRLPRHVNREDLVSAGMAALAAAARAFDPTLGVPFARFAVRRIRGALLDEVRSADWATRSVRAKARRRDVAYDVLCARLGRTPSAAELAAEMQVDVNDLDLLDGDVARAVVLSYQALQAEGVADRLMPASGETPEAVLLQRERAAYLNDAVAALPDRLRHVVVGYFFEGRPMRELAEELGVTESRISQLRAEALVLIRDGMATHLDTERAKPAEPLSPAVARRREAYYAEMAARSDFRGRLSVPAAREARESAQGRPVAQPA